MSSTPYGPVEITSITDHGQSFLNVDRLNLGCGKYPLDGYINVDDWEPADIKGDVWRLNFQNVREVRMDHFLEHIPWTQTRALLERVHGWLKPEGLIVVEVPDMASIMALGPRGDWQRYLYGSQQHEGEFHRAGFTQHTLKNELQRAGFKAITTQRFRSTFRTRPGMPCVKATACA